MIDRHAAPAGRPARGTGDGIPGHAPNPALARKAFDRLTVFGRAAAGRFNERPQPLPGSGSRPASGQELMTCSAARTRSSSSRSAWRRARDMGSSRFPGSSWRDQNRSWAHPGDELGRGDLVEADEAVVHQAAEPGRLELGRDLVGLTTVTAFDLLIAVPHRLAQPSSLLVVTDLLDAARNQPGRRTQWAGEVPPYPPPPG